MLTAKKTEGLTTPPSEIIDFAHLPLHRGGFGAVQTCSFYRIPYAERKLATESGDTQWPYLPTGQAGTSLPVGASPQIDVCRFVAMLRIAENGFPRQCAHWLGMTVVFDYYHVDFGAVSYQVVCHCEEHGGN